MVGTGDLTVIFEEQGGRLKIARVAPALNLVQLRWDNIAEPHFNDVNGP